MKTYDSAHLSPGQRQYLGRKGITGQQFDNMPPREQREWIEEMKEGSYAKNDHELGTTNARFKHY